MFLRAVLLCAATAAAVFAPQSADAATINVDVGMPNDQFSPLSVMAKAGDIIDFKFHTGQHNIFITKGFDTDDACTPADGALHLPIMPDGSEFQLRINSTNPVYLACGPHCKSNGMVMVVNPPNASVAQMFQANAKMSNPPPPPGMSGLAPGGSAGNGTQIMPMTSSATNGSMTSSSSKTSTSKNGGAPVTPASPLMTTALFAIVFGGAMFLLL